MVVPVDANVNVAQNIGEKNRNHGLKSLQVGSSRHFHFEHHNRYDHGKYAIAECFKPAFAHWEVPSAFHPLIRQCHLLNTSGSFRVHSRILRSCCHGGESSLSARRFQSNRTAELPKHRNFLLRFTCFNRALAPVCFVLATRDSTYPCRASRTISMKTSLACTGSATSRKNAMRAPCTPALVFRRR